MKPIVKWTLWQRRWSIGWWSLGVFGLIFINMIFYPTFRDQAAELEKSFESLPEAAVQLVGGSTDFFSPIGFLNSQVFFIMLPLILGILAISLGSNLIAREEQDRTIESLLSRPVSRSQLFVSKSFAGALMLGIVSIVGFLTTSIIAHVVNLDVSATKIALATFACYLLALSFGAIAILFTSLGKARVASLGLASAIALGGYLLSSLAGTVNWLSGPSKVFPFHYYQTEDILRGTHNWSNFLFLVVVIFACGVIACFTFRKRDIY